MNATNCLTIVHPGWDESEHTEFTEKVIEAIDFISKKTDWILLFVNHGEIVNSESIENINQYRIMNSIHFFFTIPSLQHFGIEIKDENGNYFYNEELRDNIPKEIFEYLIKKINISELEEIEKEHAICMEQFRTKKNIDEQAIALGEREKRFRDKIDFKALYEEIYALIGDKNLFGFSEGESINLGNKDRYRKIYQYAVEKLGTENISEIFINDGEALENQLLTDNSEFLSKDSWTLQEIDNIGCDLFGKLFNIKLKSRISKTDEAFTKLGIDKNHTNFYVIGEYLGRCVDNVADILEKRLLIDNVGIMHKLCLIKPGDVFDGKKVIYGS